MNTNNDTYTIMKGTIAQTQKKKKTLDISTNTNKQGNDTQKKNLYTIHTNDDTSTYISINTNKVIYTNMDMKSVQVNTYRHYHKFEKDKHMEHNKHGHKQIIAPTRSIKKKNKRITFIRTKDKDKH
ncbi:hypothetical protein RFI_03211 [Reticulomyxa filosa]|uniref:Uncharacterized protein n=1 Tax=Reticulomyxa filosa TaxID=46433 RepID=X6P5V7_RETFI|nr:hypothetical protein RFI_03211 [Reticulomyxa filosa]|eukprot:ETO33885.1 hypothetical protein RFI_03211 [Reticulomyxa filosa]